MKRVLFFLFISFSLLNTTVAQETKRDTLNINLSVSGGSSLGAYQAGLNWAIINFMKEMNNNPWFLEKYQEDAAPYLKLTGLAGSSAGSVNGLLATVEWYKKEITPAEQSTFYRMWINYGFEQLFPYNATDDPAFRGGIFHRKFTEEYMSDLIFSELENKEIDPKGIVDIGGTFTKLDPATFDIDGSEVNTQRFVTSFTARPVYQDGRYQLTYTLNDALIYTDRRKQNFGQLILPTFTPGPKNMKQRFEEVLEFSKASAAIPFFFEPVQLSYHHFYEQPNVEQQAYFVDGGIFDNRPLDLSLKLYNTRYGGSLEKIDPQFRLIYLDVNNRRKYDESLRIIKENTATKGFESIIRLMGGTLSSARHYELEVLYRNIDEEVFQRVEATDRYADVVGSMFGSFGAFFGMPFREYDFYTGVYDGFYFIADRMMEQFLNCKGDCDALIANIVSELYITMNLSPEAKYVINKHYMDEFNRQSLPLNLEDIDPDRRPFFDAITHSFSLYNNDIRAYNAMDPNKRNRRNEPYIRDFLNHFRDYRFIHKTGEETTIKNLLRSNPDPNLLEYNTNYSSAPNYLDRTFVEVVTDFDEFEQMLYGRIFQQWWRVENTLYKELGSKQNYEFLPEVGQFVYYKSRPRKRIGFNSSPTIIKENHYSFTQHLLPYEVSLNLADPGFELGYELFITEDRLHIPIEPLIRNLQFTRGIMFRVGLGFEQRLTRAQSIGITVGSQHAYTESLEDILKFPVNTINLNYDILNSIRISGELTDGQLSPLFGQHRPIFGFKVGIIDLNGLLYWMGRVSR